MLAPRSAGSETPYVFFNNARMTQDALKFQETDSRDVTRSLIGFVVEVPDDLAAPSKASATKTFRPFRFAACKPAQARCD